MHLETFRTFCDVIETGSLSAAARANRVTQSAVSQQLRALEQRYGQRLVERAPRTRAQPTPAGELLYRELKPLLAAFADLEVKLRARPGVLEGSVRVATVYSVGLHTLPPAIKEFLRAHRAVRVRLEYRRTDQIYAACLSGELDFGIVALPSRRAQLSVVPLFEDELVLVTPPDHPLAQGPRRPRTSRPKLVPGSPRPRSAGEGHVDPGPMGHSALGLASTLGETRRGLRVSPISLRALDGEPFVAFDRDIPTRRFIDKLLRQHQTSVSIAMELDNIETIKRSVEAGLGISILPAPALENEVRAGTLTSRPLREGPFRRPIGAIHRRGRELSAAAAALLEMLGKR